MAFGDGAVLKIDDDRLVAKLPDMGETSPARVRRSGTIPRRRAGRDCRSAISRWNSWSSSVSQLPSGARGRRPRLAGSWPPVMPISSP